MSIARRGIFGALAALPFMSRVAATAPGKTVHTVTLTVEHFGVEACWAEFEQRLDAAWGRVPTLFPGERFHTIVPDLRRDLDVVAPYGWDTLENAR